MKFNFTLMPKKARGNFNTLEEYDKYNTEREEEE